MSGEEQGLDDRCVWRRAGLADCRMLSLVEIRDLLAVTIAERRGWLTDDEPGEQKRLADLEPGKD